VTVVDETGAGDSFNRAYLAARLRGASVSDAARGSRQSSLEITAREADKMACLPVPEFQLTIDCAVWMAPCSNSDCKWLTSSLRNVSLWGKSRPKTSFTRR
jgi:hypothetical protein